MITSESMARPLYGEAIWEFEFYTNRTDDRSTVWIDLDGDGLSSEMVTVEMRESLGKMAGFDSFWRRVSPSRYWSSTVGWWLKC